MISSAIEYGNKGIQINCLAPGFVESSYADIFLKIIKNNTNGLFLKLL